MFLLFTYLLIRVEQMLAVMEYASPSGSYFTVPSMSSPGSGVFVLLNLCLKYIRRNWFP